MMPTGKTRRDRGGRHLRPRAHLLGSASWAALMAMVSQENARRTEEAAATEPGPTRRALLALLPASLLDGGAAVSDPAPPHRSTGSRSIESCWADLVAAITDQDRAIGRRDHLERLLVRHFEGLASPAVTQRLPHDPAYAPEDGFVAIGDVLEAIKRSLADRHVAWERAAALTGLTQAEDAQALARSGVRQAATDLIMTPTTDLTHLRLKLIALLAVHEPGPACRHATPWRELRIILADVERLLRSP